MYETSCQSRFDARYWMLGAGALGRPSEYGNAAAMEECYHYVKVFLKINLKLK